MFTLVAPRPVIPESVDPEAVSPSGPWRAFKQFGLVLLCAAWVGLGLAGHDPWKADDATTIGVAAEMAQRNDLLVPMLAGEPLLERPPLAYAAPALAIHSLTPPLSRHNAARLTVGVALAVMLLFTALASRELNGRAYRWLPVLILVGSVGFWERAHALAPEIFLTAAVAVALYGIALALRRPIAGGVALGIAMAIAFWTRGLIGPLWFALTALLLPLVSAQWRHRAWGVTLLVAFALALPLMLAWPFALRARDPALFALWWQSESLLRHFPLGSAGFEPFYFLRNLIWFAFPAIPLLMWLLWLRLRGFNGGMRVPGIEAPGVLALVMLATLMLMPEPRLTNALPLLVPLALLACLEVDSLKRGFSDALDWFGILTFGLLAIVFWGFWIDSYVNGMSLRVARLFRDTEIGFQPSFHLGTMLAAVGLTVLWIMLVRPARRSNRRTVLNWAAGVTLIWGLYATIWLPYLDSRRSYRPVVESASVYFPAQGCIASRNLGEPQRAVFFYFAGLRTVREEINPDHGCPALLVQYGRLDVDPVAPEGWRRVWDGRRRGDDTERYQLYLRDKK